MTSGGEGACGAPLAAGGPAGHVPVMLNEVVAALNPASRETHIDGTFGGGGYARAILDTGADVIAIDRDPIAIAAGGSLAAASAGRLMLAEGRFSELDRIALQAGHQAVDGVVLDIGVSSMQIDEAERGFSFQKDGPLDMRMEGAGVSAADVVNCADHKTLTRIIGLLGEERHASRIARAIVTARRERPFARTLQLAGLIEQTIGRKPGERIHPATRTFQGLRIFVNRELEELGLALFAAERILRRGGRLAVVTFHSLEDRIVKRFFADRSGRVGGSRHLPQVEAKPAIFVQKKRGAMAISAAEAAANPRARSAKLRSGVRTDAPVGDQDMGLFGLPELNFEGIGGDV